MAHPRYALSRAAISVLLSFSLAGATSVAAAQPYLGGSNARSRPAQTAIADAAGKASLNFPPAQGDALALQCDQLGDSPADPARIGDGVAFNAIQPDQALPACQAAAASGRPRYQFVYGRVLLAAMRDQDAAAQLIASDRAGDAMASFTLARLYRDGIGVDKDTAEAVRLYFRAANAGLIEAFADGGELFALDNPPNYVEAKSWFERAVQGGSGDGYSDLGMLYDYGMGVPQDQAKAFSLYSEAAKRQSDAGFFRVGLAYFYGRGVQKNQPLGCQWLIRAANDGNTNAEQEAARCYYNGIGVAADHAKAFDLFATAGQAGLLESQVIVADMLENGDGHNQDFQYAVMWYQAAANQGDAYSMTELGAHLRLGKGIAWSEAQAMQWFGKAAQMAYVPAETSLAIGYLNGLGQDAGQGRQDYAQAFAWFSKAAQQNDDYANLNLGVMYENGWGVPQDLNRAKQLYARAAGSSNSQIADLGRQYFDNVQVTPGSAPQRTVASSSTDSSNFWTAVIVGGLAIGALAWLTSGSSDSSSSSSSSSCCFSASSSPSWPTSTSSEPVPDMAPTRPQLYDPRDPTRIVMGDLTDPALATK